MVKVGGKGAQPHLLSVCPPANILALAAKTWPGLHCMRAVVLYVFCYHNIVTVIVTVVHTPSLHHRLSLWCKVGVRAHSDMTDVGPYRLLDHSLTVCCHHWNRKTTLNMCVNDKNTEVAYPLNIYTGRTNAYFTP